MIRKLTMALVCAGACLLAAAEMPRSEWHGKVGACAQNPDQLKQVIAQLSPADQVAFVAEVNAAVAELPGSVEERSAAFVAANRAAVVACSKDNRAKVLAEVFATVPPEHLTVINEVFAKELFNRQAAKKAFTDAEYVGAATNTLAVIVERSKTAEYGDVRATFAILMFIRASGGSPADLASTLVQMLPGQQEVALNEWIASAMGTKGTPTYDPMLGVSSAGDEPDHSLVLQMTGAQTRESMLSELALNRKLGSGTSLAGYTLTTAAGVEDSDMTRINTRTVPVGSVSKKRGEKQGSSEPQPSPEPPPYYGQ